MPRHRNTTDTHCKNGHRWTEENTYVNSTTGNRYCRECRRHHYQRRKAAKKVEHRHVNRRMYLHDHSPFAKECNPGCGWYWARKDGKVELSNDEL